MSGAAKPRRDDFMLTGGRDRLVCAIDTGDWFQMIAPSMTRR
jgi:hypothetical protein